MTEQPVWSETDSRGFQDPAEIAATAREKQMHARHGVITCAQAGCVTVSRRRLRAGYAIYGGYR